MALSAVTGPGFLPGTHLNDRLPAEWSEFLAEQYFCQLVRDLPAGDYEECLSVVLAVCERLRDPQIYLPAALRLLALCGRNECRDPVLYDGGLMEWQPTEGPPPIRSFHGSWASVRIYASRLTDSSDLGRLSALPRGAGTTLYTDVDVWLTALSQYERPEAVRKMNEGAPLQATREQEVARLRESFAPHEAAPVRRLSPATTRATAPITRPATAPARPEDDNPGPAGEDASAAWGLANEFVARQDFARKYPKKGSAVRGKAKDVFDVSFSPLDKADVEIVVHVDLRNRQCLIVEQERSKKVGD